MIIGKKIGVKIYLCDAVSWNQGLLKLYIKACSSLCAAHNWFWDIDTKVTSGDI